MQTFLDWLVADFYVFSLHFQHWMLVFVVVFVVLLIHASTDSLRPRK